MVVPLFLDQLLVMLVGIADTFVISHCGEAAVSGVSLVNQFNTIWIYLFTAIASGGAVVISQYIGSRDLAMAGKAASQLALFSGVFSLAAGAVVLLGSEAILRGMFGRVEPDVMEACITYLRISAYSYPMMALYHAGASVYRSMGKTDTTMYISAASNLINVVGNCIGVFVLHAGVAGVAYPSLIARTFSAVWITALCFSRRKPVHYQTAWRWDFGLLRKILGIAIPNGVDNGVFQLVKVALSSIVALFGTYQIAANGVAQSIWSLAALSGVAMGPAFITVIGQCMGARDLRSAESYFRKLLRITLVLSAVWNGLTLALTPVFLRFFALEAVAFPFSGALGNGLRAAGDVKYTMYTSILTTLGVRLIFSYVFAVLMGLGVMGIAWAMCADWTVRGLLFFLRMRSGAWEKYQVV